MSPARFWTFAALAACCAGILTFTEQPDARVIFASASGATGLSAIRLSGAEVSNAMALTGFAVLVCSSRFDCAR